MIRFTLSKARKNVCDTPRYAVKSTMKKNNIHNNYYHAFVSSSNIVSTNSILPLCNKNKNNNNKTLLFYKNQNQYYQQQHPFLFKVHNKTFVSAIPSRQFPERNWTATTIFRQQQHTVSQRALNILAIRRSKTTPSNLSTSLFFHLSKFSTQHEETYRKLYHRFDKYGDGKISVDEFVSRSRDLGLQVTEQEIEMLYNEFEFKTKGEMDFDEFTKFMISMKEVKLTMLEGTDDDEKIPVEEEKDITNKWSFVNMKDQFMKEYTHYKRGFTLLNRQLIFAWKRLLFVLEGRKLSKYEYRKVMRAMTDVVRLLPMIGLVALPGGSILVPLVAKKYPQLLPTTFHEKNMPHKRQLDMITLEVAAAVDEMERKVRKENLRWKDDDLVYLKLTEWINSRDNNGYNLDMFNKDTGEINNESVSLLVDQLGVDGLIDRLDADALFLIVKKIVSRSRARALNQAPVPLVRALIMRHLTKVVTRNKKLKDEIFEHGLVGAYENMDDKITFFNNRCIRETNAIDDEELSTALIELWSNIDNTKYALFAIMLNAAPKQNGGVGAN